MSSPFSNLDPHELDRSTEQLMSLINSNLPDPPVSTTARLRALLDAPSDGVDRISRLSDALLRDIVSRLPAKDAARTASLAARWRGVWRSTPLVLVDSHMLPNSALSTSSPDVTAAVSRVLAAHPGPFRCVHLTCGSMGEHQAHLSCWLRLLAARGVEELVLINRPGPRDVPLPKTLFTISTLTRLYIGVWKFPDAAGLRGASFPNLRELGICSVAVKSGDIDAVVARSPALEILNIQGTMNGVRLRLVSNSLRCVQICAFLMESIEVVNAPCLERLILSECLSPVGGSCTKVKIGNVPKLSLFGHLEPAKSSLEIQGTVILAGIETTAGMMVTSVKTLSLKVCFGVHNDIKMVHALLKRFPNVEALHIMSEKCDQPAGKLSVNFWEELGPILSVRLRIKVMTYCQYQAQEEELAFLQFIFQNAFVLKHVLVQMMNPKFTSLSMSEMSTTLHNMNDEEWLSNFTFAIGGTHDLEGGESWSFRRGADFTDDDPFAPVKFILKGEATG